jgi:hypothetical protein
MADEFSLDAIPLLTGYAQGALQAVHDDISEREGVGGDREIVIKLKVNPDTLLMTSSVETKLPKGDYKWKVGKVALYRENGVLKVGDSSGQQRALFSGSGDDK